MCYGAAGMSRQQRVRLTAIMAVSEAVAIVLIVVAGGPLFLVGGISFAVSLAIILIWLQR